MKKLAVAILLTLASVAYGSVYTRQHSATIVEGKRILADDLNDEFNAIATAVNSVDSSNITDGSLTATDAAATSSLVITNRRSGCLIERAADQPGNKAVFVRTPCEIVMDGVRMVLTATATVSLVSNLESSSTLHQAMYYYLYATRNSASMLFGFSQTAPNLSTSRKIGDTNSRYIGTVRTGDATQDIVAFETVGAGTYIWHDNTDGLSYASRNLTATLTSSSADYTVDMPAHFKAVKLRSTSFTDGFPAQCQYTAGNSTKFQVSLEATDGNVQLMPEWVPVTASGTLSGLKFDNIKNCFSGGKLQVQGWQEPLSLHQ